MAISVTFFTSCVNSLGQIEVACQSDETEIITVTLRRANNTIVSTKISPTQTSYYEPFFENIPNGDYYLEVSGSDSGTDVTYPGDINEIFINCEYIPPCDLVINSVVINNDINAQGVGKITVNATSSFPLQYAITGTVSRPLQSSNVFENLPSGGYTIFAEDTNDCSQNTTRTIDNIPCDIQISVLFTHETGIDLNDGTANVAGTSSNGAISYRLDSEGFSSTDEWTGLSPGVHTIYAIDAAGCTTSQNFTINAFAEPPQPEECFNPILVISELNPYRFVLKHCNPSDDIDKLYNEREMCGVYQPCYFQPVLCDDLFTLQIQYTEEEFGSPSITYNTIPRLRIIDHFTQEVLYTLPFTDLGSGIYKIEKNLDELPNICEKKVYLEIISYSSFFDEEYYTHARSEGIHFSNYHECTTLMEYWNDSDYNNTYYEETGYINNLRIEGIFDEEDLPQESEVYVKSNGQRVLLSEVITEVWSLEVGHSPFYLHKIIALALSHDHVRINGREYVKEEPYSFERIKDYSLRKGLGKLTAKTYQSKNLIY